jgi:hypothetical protein
MRKNVVGKPEEKRRSKDLSVNRRQSVMLHFSFWFCMVLTVNGDYFLKQH